MSERKTELIKRCNDLEHRFRILQSEGMNCNIGIMWARQWADVMLDTRGPVEIYANWIEQQEKRADRLEKQHEH